ncbi:MAG: cobalt-precorrin-7 (C(5))-methyltransferase [Methanoregulaceae archaeon]
MKILGVGCGPGMLTEEAIAVLRSATLVYGSDRALDLVAHYLPEGCESHIIEDYKGLRTLPADALVLSTGDPMLAGLGYLDGEVIPGISSLQVVAARLRLPLTRVAVITAHGTDHGKAIREAVEEIGRGKVAFILADPEFSLPDLARAAERAGHHPDIAVCEDLGYPSERIAIGDTQHPPEILSPRLYAVLAGSFASRK